MKKTSLTAVLFFVYSFVFAQQPNIKHVQKKPSDASQKTVKRTNRIMAEICSNNIDDDGNGLTDAKDYKCFFENQNTSNACGVSKVLWGCGNSNIYWIDVETGITREIQTSTGFYDIAWGLNGKLYGTDWVSSHLYEINPENGQYTFLKSLDNYNFINSITADADNNLVMSGRTIADTWEVFRVNLSTYQVQKLLDLGPLNLIPAGDLTFMDGYLYLSCNDGKIAKINYKTNTAVVLTVKNPVIFQGYGFTTLGDGFLYFSSGGNMYKLDPVSMESTFVRLLPSVFTYGFGTYPESCNSPSFCALKLSIDTVTPKPFCAVPGVKLKAIGTGLADPLEYTWTLPNSTKIKGDSLSAVLPGMYRVRYASLSDTCAKEDSIYLEIIDNRLSLFKNDTAICENTTISLRPDPAFTATSYLWQDGSTNSTLSTSKAGIYWVEITNDCGTKRDSITVLTYKSPVVNIGIDTVICQQSSIPLQNTFPEQSVDKYLWSTGSTTKNLSVTSAGSYWLEVSNFCGIMRDTIEITAKDSCVCIPFVPKASIGTDIQLCPGDSMIISNLYHENGFRYLWNTGNNTQSILVKDTGLYLLSVTTYCGTETDYIYVSEKTDFCDKRIYMPNAFTPNKDQINDIYKPIISGGITDEYLFSIYDRWGNLIFETRDTKQGWDGNYNGIPQNPGTYVWKVSYRFKNLSPQVSSGTFLLMR